MPVPPQMVAQQLRAVLSDLEPKAIKIGILPNIEVAQVVADELRTYLAQHPVPVVYDPVMVSTSGYPLMAPDAVQLVVSKLFRSAHSSRPTCPKLTACCNSSKSPSPRRLYRWLAKPWRGISVALSCSRVGMPISRR